MLTLLKFTYRNYITKNVLITTITGNNIIIGPLVQDFLLNGVYKKLLMLDVLKMI